MLCSRWPSRATGSGIVFNSIFSCLSIRSVDDRRAAYVRGQCSVTPGQSLRQLLQTVAAIDIVRHDLHALKIRTSLKHHPLPIRHEIEFLIPSSYFPWGELKYRVSTLG